MDINTALDAGDFWTGPRLLQLVRESLVRDETGRAVAQGLGWHLDGNALELGRRLQIADDWVYLLTYLSRVSPAMGDFIELELTRATERQQ